MVLAPRSDGEGEIKSYLKTCAGICHACRVDGEVRDLSESINLERYKQHTTKRSLTAWLLNRDQAKVGRFIGIGLENGKGLATISVIGARIISLREICLFGLWFQFEEMTRECSLLTVLTEFARLRRVRFKMRSIPNW